MNQREQIAITSRVFCLAAIFGFALVGRHSAIIQTVVVITVVAAMSAYVSWVSPTTRLMTTIAEALVVGVLTGLAFPSSFILLPYLAVLPLLAGLTRGVPGVVSVVVAEGVASIFIPLAATGFVGMGDRISAFAPWILTNFGAGLLGAWARQLGDGPELDGDRHYESAHQLLMQLRTVTRRLPAGLDSHGIAAQLLAHVHDQLSDAQSAVFVNMRGSVLVPLGYLGARAQQVLLPNDPLIDECWTQMEPVQGIVPAGTRSERHRTVLPLRVGNRMVGVVVSAGPERARADQLTSVLDELSTHAIRIDTALVFDELRTTATADERRRLAREIHDGIAQEVASLGYLVDDISSTADDPRTLKGLNQLRAELSRLVGDLRLSIFDLRSDVSPSSGLGAALSDYVRQVGAKSNLTVHLSLDEAPTRLAPTVETEIFRIAQEAITNARKHASASNLWVDWWTDPPMARLTVRDDGHGINGGRDDSFGMAIMRERANRIDATLEIGSAGDTVNKGKNAPEGTIVTVSVTSKGDVALESLSK